MTDFAASYFTLQAPVRAGVTFKAPLPSGVSATNVLAAGHKITVFGSIFESSDDFALAIGAADVSVTWLAATSLPAGTKGALSVALVVDSTTYRAPWLTPEDFGAVGDGVVDDSVAFALLLTAASAQRRAIRLGPSSYLLNGAAMMPVVGGAPLLIEGAGMAVSKILLGTSHRGPALAFSDTNRSVAPGGAFRLAGFRIEGTRSLSIPLGAQAGILFFDRHDHPVLENISVESIRGTGIGMGRSYSTNVGYVRETTWLNVSVYNCGGGPLWPAVDLEALNAASDESNNIWAYGCRFSFNQGPNLRISSPDGKKSGGTTSFPGLMIHGGVQAAVTLDADLSYSGWDLVEINGEVQNVNLTNVVFNASQAGQFLVSFDNRYRYNVTLPSGAIATTNGSTTVTVTAPSLPTRTIPAADITTEKGSSVVTVYWPAHGFAAGQWITFDNWGEDGVRNLPQYNINGVVLTGEQTIHDVVDEDYFQIRARRGIATASATAEGSATYGTSKILRRTYGVIDNTTTISWATWSGGVVTQSTVTVNAVPLSGNKTLTTFGGPNVWRFTSSIAADATSTYGSETTVSMFSSMLDPTLINVSGRSNSGVNGVDVRWGRDLSINMPSPTSGIDLQVSENIRGDVIFSAETRETAYNLVIPDAVAHLVSGAVFPSAALPQRSDMQALGTVRAGQSFTRTMLGTTTGTTARRLTANGTQSLSAANAWALPRAGTYIVHASVVARQTGGASGTVGDSARWAIEALVTWDGTAGAVVVEEANGSAAGTALAPAGSRGAGSAWRVAVTADTSWDAVAITGTGADGKVIAWNARVERTDAYQA